MKSLMKKIYSFFLLLFTLTLCTNTKAQCTTAELNWDFLDFLPSNAINYTSHYTSSAFPYSQNFALGTRRLSFTMTPASNIILEGENAINTGHASSVATAGDDVQFTTITSSNSTVLMSLDSNVTSMNFSLFDLDNNQRVTIIATNAMGVPQSITVSRANALSAITIGGTGTAPIVTGPNGGYANNSNLGTINVRIAGPVKNVLLTLNNAAGDIWLSDIRACVTGAFASNWRNISRPFTGMPGYIITVVNKRLVMLDPATGNAKDIFTDPSTYSNNINGLCYDPVRRRIYYSYSLSTTPANTKIIQYYDIDTESPGTILPDVNTVGIPTYQAGLESGSASFYNGSLYYGVEGSFRNSSGSPDYGGREHTVWKIDFNALNVPYRSTQVYSVKSDSIEGGEYVIKHDWSDIAVTSNGMLYDFDGARGDSAFFHFNMMTGQQTQYNAVNTGIHYPKQTGVDWAENVYNMGDSIRTSPSTGFIVPYNYNGTVNASLARRVTINGVAFAGSWGDCGEAFRPLCDFGDAPASYDPDPLSPAVHERDVNLRIGATFDREWLKSSSATATLDGSDEDGLSYVPVLAPGYTMSTQVAVYNNTGVQARLLAWVDLNGNGIFETTEVCNAPTLINSMASMQNVPIVWPAVRTATSTLAIGSYTYLRIRLVRASSLPVLNSSRATGYYDNGEVEDYRVIVDNYPLAINLVKFEATKEGSQLAKIVWTANEDATITHYQIEKSSDATNWVSLASQTSDDIAGTSDYFVYDNNPVTGINYYRLAYKEADGVKKYSAIKSVLFSPLNNQVTLIPNPAKDRFTINLYNNANATVLIKIYSANGKVLLTQKGIAHNGQNAYGITIPEHWAEGLYMVQISCGEETIFKKLLINK
ncbi:MAG: hypothetical protein RL115_848 [Bacteroidota bacterium]|jgi:hypothetical protein